MISDKKYNIIYSDPPWNFKTWSDKGGEKSATNIINAIEKSKFITLTQFINGLGIRNIGSHASKILDKTFDSNIENSGL